MKRKRRYPTTKERYGHGYEAYTRAYQEREKRLGSLKTVEARRELKPMLTREQYRHEATLFEYDIKQTNIERRKLGLKPQYENINKLLVDDVTYELSAKQGRVLQKVVGERIAEERYLAGLRRQHPELSDIELGKITENMKFEPVYVPLSRLRAGELLSDIELKGIINNFWTEVSSSRGHLIREYMDQGYSYKQANRMAYDEIGRVFFDSP